MEGTVLVADDDRTIRTVLTQALTRAGCKVHATSSLTTLLRWITEGRGDLVISDVAMPDGNGIEQLPAISERRPDLPVIIISAQNTIMTAIQATEADAYDYLPKPFDLPDLMKRVAQALETRPRRTSAVQREVGPERELPLVGKTAAMQNLYRVVARIVHTDLPVLISGESGTGKSLIARTIHDFSDRRSLPFVVPNASDMASATEVSTQVARARGGTILFDEIGEFDDETQGRIVRTLDALGDSPPRVMATSQRDLSAQMDAGTFRKDLYFRLSGATVAMPTLRDRVDDVPLLADHFLAHAEREGLPLRRLSKEALELVRHYTWPGNVRQLENAMRRLAATSAAETITRAELDVYLSSQPALELSVEQPGDRLSGSVEKHLRRYFDLHGGMLPPPGLYGRILREMELPLLEISLEATGGNQAKCADLLGINRNTLRKKITELDIRVTRRRKLM